MKKIKSGEPFFSIITIVYNDKTNIERTLLSVLNQGYKNFEYIVVDGGSTDGTVDVIKKYENHINIYLSEPDKGIYDAMNKGIKLAKGKWINFMNSGDQFYDSNVLDKVYGNIDNEVDVLYGSCKKAYNNGIVKTVIPKQLKELSKGMVFSHQSMFVRTAIHKERLFDDTFKLSADYDFIFYLYKNSYKFYDLDFEVSMVMHEGLSVNFGDLSIKEAMRVQLKYGGYWSNIFYFYYLRINRVIRNFFKKILPKTVVNFFLEKEV
jgi:glycosyltransferase involved in cell wall biosynthesis